LSKISYGIFSSQQLLTDAFPEYAVTEECKCKDFFNRKDRSPFLVLS
jgi:hypothetical protein